MAMTVSRLPAGVMEVEVSTDGSTWLDFSGAVTAISHSGGEQQIGRTHVLGSDKEVIVPSGKITAYETTVTALWNQESNEPTVVLNTIRDTSGPRSIYLRFMPEGYVNGKLSFTSADDSAVAPAAITTLTMPSATAGGDILQFEFTIVTPDYIEATISV